MSEVRGARVMHKRRVDSRIAGVAEIFLCISNVL
jgi:hypothetical protein